MSLSKFEIMVSDVNDLGNFSSVSILWYDSRCSAPCTFDHHIVGDTIFVDSPNMLERLCGRTFKSKLEAAKKKLTIRAERHLRRNQEMQVVKETL